MREPQGPDAVDPLEVERLVDRAIYPATPGELVEAARQRGAPDVVLQALWELPDRTYGDASSVAHAIGAAEAEK